MTKNFGFGFMRLPLLHEDDQTSIDFVSLEKMVDIFMEKGFTYFDTALLYHGGKSEEALRKVLVERFPRESFTIATKLPPRVVKKTEEQEDIFDGQLKRCGVDFFDYYLLHNIGMNSYQQAIKFDTFGFVQKKKEEGKVKHIGMSFHDKPELLDEILRTHPELDFVQLQINYIDWENPGIQSKRCWEVARKYNKPISVMEPCKGGNLAIVPEEAEKLMKAIDPDASVPSWAFRFAASQEGVFMVLSGMSNVEQVIQNTESMADFKPLTKEEYGIIAKVTDIINAQTVIPCTACRYCEEVCPKKIAIPDYFALYNSAKRAITNKVSSQFVYYMNLALTHGSAGDCIVCRQCEKVCPQHLHIPDFLKKISAEFDGMKLPSK